MKRHMNGYFKDGAAPPAEYWVWTGMRERCHNMQCWAWKWYGGKGIKVCERWDDPAIFMADMGPRPSKAHTIERIDSDKDYEPDNCRWATMQEQCANRGNAIIIDGMRIREIADALGLDYSSVYGRMKRGWSPWDIANQPKITDGTRTTNRLLTVRGKTQSLTEWARQAGLSVQTIASRLESGWSANDAVRPGLHRAKGERSPHAKLTSDQVEEIRSSSEIGTVLARKFGVSSTLIYAIKKGRAWA